MRRKILVTVLLLFMCLSVCAPAVCEPSFHFLHVLAPLQDVYLGMSKDDFLLVHPEAELMTPQFDDGEVLSINRWRFYFDSDSKLIRAHYNTAYGISTDDGLYLVQDITECFQDDPRMAKSREFTNYIWEVTKYEVCILSDLGDETPPNKRSVSIHINFLMFESAASTDPDLLTLFTQTHRE